METSDTTPASSKDFLDIQAAIECRLSLKHVRDMIITNSQIHLHISTHNTAQAFGQFG